ncbi:MAG: electron transport complex subunit E, partial [Lachnospiraceae bacterium]|nr:electron transport complex subunit E [Lachnospiraceae bacterium]
MSELSERLLNGILKENPTFVLLLGMCPTLAVTTCAVNGLGMGVTTMVVLALSNLFISLLRKVIPDKIRIPAFIVIIASFVTMVELLLKAYIPSLYSALGLYIPLIVVNCIILGRAEAYAYSHGPFLSLFDGIGMGMGFTIALTIIGSFRELLGAGTLFNANVMPKGFVPVSIFIMAPGAFFVLAMLTAIQNAIKIAGEKKGKDMSKIQSGCGKDCEACATGCSLKPKDEVKTEEVKEVKEKAPVKEEPKDEPVKVETLEEPVESDTSKEEVKAEDKDKGTT